MCPFHLTVSQAVALVTSRAYLDSLMSENLSFILPQFCIALRNATDYIRYLYCNTLSGQILDARYGEHRSNTGMQVQVFFNTGKRRCAVVYCCLVRIFIRFTLLVYRNVWG